MTTNNEKLNRLLGFFEHDGSNIDLALDIARIFNAKGEYQGLLDWASTIASPSVQNNPALRHDLALASMVVGDMAAARIQFEQLLTQFPQSAEVRYNLAYTLYGQENFAQALEVLAGITEASITNQSTLLTARCLHQLNLLDSAGELLEKRLAIVDDVNLRAIYALILQDLGQNDKAHAQAQDALDKSPQNLDALVALASAQLAQQNVEEAQKTVSKALVYFPKIGRLWSLQGQIEMLGQNFTGAEKSLSTATLLMPSHIGTWHLLTWIYIISGRYEEAKSAMETALELDRNFADSHGGMAIIFALTGDHVSAKKAIKLALHLDVNSASALFAKSLVLRAAHGPREADALVEKLYRGLGDRSQGFMSFAQAVSKQNRK